MAETMAVLTVAELDELLERAAERGARKVLEERVSGAANDSEWLDASDVGKLLNVNPRSVQKYVRRNGLPVHRIGERLFRYRRAEVEEWIARRAG